MVMAVSEATRHRACLQWLAPFASCCLSAHAKPRVRIGKRWTGGRFRCRLSMK